MKKRRARSASGQHARSIGPALALLAAGCALPAPQQQPDQTAATPTINTSRPSFTDSTSLVPAGHLQLETGYTFTQRDHAGVATERHAVPELLARYRVLDRLEGQLLFAGYQFLDTRSGGSDSATDGASDIGVGILVPVEDQHGLMPTLALGGIATLGTGSEDFTTKGHTVVAGKLLWSYASVGGFDLAGSFVLANPRDGQERFAQTAASVVATRALDSRTSLFAEYYVVAPYANHTGPAHNFDGGVLYLLDATVQLDARVGFGLNDEADDFSTGIGISFLF